jgi:hypothetical protein
MSSLPPPASLPSIGLDDDAEPLTVGELILMPLHDDERIRLTRSG